MVSSNKIEAQHTQHVGHSTYLRFSFLHINFLFSFRRIVFVNWKRFLDIDVSFQVGRNKETFEFSFSHERISIVISTAEEDKLCF